MEKFLETDWLQSSANFSKHSAKMRKNYAKKFLKKIFSENEKN